MHPVVSVITLTATGLLCYAGHVCNYYVKVLDWFRTLPAVLRDKRWFLIKRRRSIGAAAGETKQKKPTTANRARLESAIREAQLRMPNVYEGSVVLVEELAKFPVDGEQEMLEHEENVDLTGDVKIDRETFIAWADGAVTRAAPLPCASAIMLYATNQQGLDMRGAVAGDTAWELCCRLLTRPLDTHALSSRDLAQLLVYLLDQQQLPDQMRQELYKGMLIELAEREKTVQTQADEDAMKCRWLRLAIHKELDMVRETMCATADDIDVDLEVQGTMAEATAPSITAEAEKEATALLQALQEDKGRRRSVGLSEGCDDDEAWAAYADEDEVEPDMEALNTCLTDVAASARDVIEQVYRAKIAESVKAEDYSAAVTLDKEMRGLLIATPGVEEAYASRIAALVKADNVAVAAEVKGRMREVLACIATALDTSQGEKSPGDTTAVPVAAPADSRASVCDAGTETRPADKPLVDPPEFGDRIKDTDKEPFWIPGAFPTIFQNETGDPHNYITKEVDLTLWGPHVLRSKGWAAQAHMTFMYWWMNMIQRMQALSAKKWYIRDNPQSNGYTAEDLAGMSVSWLAKRMVGYTAGIPGSKASKGQLRKLILAMMRQIEIETRLGSNKPLGDIPCFFGTLTSQRYHWDGIIRALATVEGIEDYGALSKSKRRALVNKYPLFVAWYCSMRLELVLKTIVVPIFGAYAYMAVYEWSPTGA